MEFIIKATEEEQRQFNLHLKGVDWAVSVLELDRYLRNKIKYEEVEVIEVQHVRDIICEILDRHGISFDDID